MDVEQRFFRHTSSVLGVEGICQATEVSSGHLDEHHLGTRSFHDEDVCNKMLLSEWAFANWKMTIGLIY